MLAKILDVTLNPQEKTILIALSTASAVVWGIMAFAIAGQFGPPSMAHDVDPPAIPHTPTPVAQFTPSPTVMPSPTLTGADPLPTATASPSPTVTPTPTPVGSAPMLIDDDTLVIALLGIDEKKTAGVWRTDSIHLALVDQKSREMDILSVPRDLWVLIPGHGSNRVNTVDALGERTRYPGGGPALLDRTLRHNLGVRVDHYVRIDFDGFRRIIDAVGGVTVNVEKPLRDAFPDPNSPARSGWITLPAGPHHMDGRMALSYCRSRMTTNDFDRSRRQQQVLIALWKQALTLETLIRAPKLWAQFRDAFETDLDMVQAVQLVYVAHGIGMENARPLVLGPPAVRPWTTPGGAQVLLPRRDVIQQVILDLLTD